MARTGKGREKMFSKRDGRMRTKKIHEGYVMIDHRLGEGITPEQAAAAGRGTIPVAAGQLFESPTINCSHCQVMVVLNPDRSRSRGYCPKCDHYVCDTCEAERVRTGVCRPFSTQVIDEFIDKAAKADSTPSLVILTPTSVDIVPVGEWLDQKRRESKPGPP